MNKQISTAALCLFGAAALFLSTSCSPSVILTVTEEASGTAHFTAEMTPAAENLVRRFTGNTASAAANPNGNQLFDRDKIRLSLAHAGIKTETVTFPGRTGISLGVSFLKLDGLLARAVTVSKEERRIEIRLSPESVNAATAVMPPETADYLALLMAPVFTGEKMDSAEYESVIAAAYGKTLAAELKGSTFTLTVRCPAPVKNIAAGSPAVASSSENTAVFAIPLAELLAMDKPITVLAEW